MYLLTQDFNEKSYINKMFCLVHTSQFMPLQKGCFLKIEKKEGGGSKHCPKQIICRHEEIKA